MQGNSEELRKDRTPYGLISYAEFCCPSPESNGKLCKECFKLMVWGFCLFLVYLLRYEIYA